MGNVNGELLEKNKKRIDRKKNHYKREKEEIIGRDKEKEGEMKDSECLYKRKYRRDITEDRTVGGEIKIGVKMLVEERF